MIFSRKLAKEIFKANPVKFEFTLTRGQLYRDYEACEGGRESAAKVAGPRFDFNHALPLALLAEKVSDHHVDWVLTAMAEKDIPLARQLLIDLINGGLVVYADLPSSEDKGDAARLIALLDQEASHSRSDGLNEIYRQQRQRWLSRPGPEDEFSYLLKEVADLTFSLGDHDGAQEFIAELVRLRVIPHVTRTGKLLVVAES